MQLKLMAITIFMVPAALSAIGFAADPPMESVPVTEGLVAAWDFRGEGAEVARDVTGNGHDAKIGGAPTYVDSPTGRALVLDDRLRVYVKDHEALRLQDALTIDAWIRVDEPSDTYRAVLVKGNAAYRMQVSPKNTAYFGIKGTVPDNSKPRLDFGRGALKLKTWHRITAVWQKPVITLYVDGEKVGSGKKDITPHLEGSLTIGSYGGKSYKFEGMIDQIRLYNIPRPPQAGDEKPIEMKPEEGK